MIKEGAIGQAYGPFLASDTNIIPLGYNMIIGVSIPEKDFMLFEEDEDLGFYFMLNGEEIKIGKSGMYEMDEPMGISSLTFPKGAPASTLVEYRVYD